MKVHFPLNNIASDQLGREVFTNEFVPKDFFSRQSLSDIFNSEAPSEIDLGCGDGSFVTQLADHYPDRNFLAVERLLGRVKKVCKKGFRKELTNLKVLRLETLYTTEWLLPRESFDRIHLICPDPWPKEKHHKNRLMQEPFFESIHKLLKENGEFLFRTDHEEYYEWSKERMESCPLFQIEPWDESDFYYPKSDFQLQWEAEGKTLSNMRCIKR